MCNSVVCVCVCVCSVSAALLAALHLSVSLRDIQWSAESVSSFGTLLLAVYEQCSLQPLDQLPDTNVSLQSNLDLTLM